MIMLLVVSVIVDTDGPVAVYCNGHKVWPRRDWIPLAACRGVDPNVFVPDNPRRWTPAPVMQLCPPCPVRDACREYGRATRSSGWWGGEYLPLPSSAHRPRGEKLTWDQAVEIRQRYAHGGVLQRDLAEDYGVTLDSIKSIITGRAWKVR